MLLALLGVVITAVSADVTAAVIFDETDGITLAVLGTVILPAPELARGRNGPALVREGGSIALGADVLAAVPRLKADCVALTRQVAIKGIAALALTGCRAGATVGLATQAVFTDVGIADIVTAARATVHFTSGAVFSEVGLTLPIAAAGTTVRFAVVAILTVTADIVTAKGGQFAIGTAFILGLADTYGIPFSFATVGVQCTDAVLNHLVDTARAVPVITAVAHVHAAHAHVGSLVGAQVVPFGVAAERVGATNQFLTGGVLTPDGAVVTAAIPIAEAAVIRAGDTGLFTIALTVATRGGDTATTAARAQLAGFSGTDAIPVGFAAVGILGTDNGFTFSHFAACDALLLLLTAIAAGQRTAAGGAQVGRTRRTQVVPLGFTAEGVRCAHHVGAHRVFALGGAIGDAAVIDTVAAVCGTGGAVLANLTVADSIPAAGAAIGFAALAIFANVRVADVVATASTTVSLTSLAIFAKLGTAFTVTATLAAVIGAALAVLGAVAIAVTASRCHATAGGTHFLCLCGADAVPFHFAAPIVGRADNSFAVSIFAARRPILLHATVTARQRTATGGTQFNSFAGADAIPDRFAAEGIHGTDDVDALVIVAARRFPGSATAGPAGTAVIGTAGAVLFRVAVAVATEGPTVATY